MSDLIERKAVMDALEGMKEETCHPYNIERVAVHNHAIALAQGLVSEIPAADVPQIVRCSKCSHYRNENEDNNPGWRHEFCTQGQFDIYFTEGAVETGKTQTHGNWFCGDGKDSNEAD